MLKLTKKADYGLIALKHLAVNSGGVSSSAKAIAECYGIPLPLLAKILLSTSVAVTILFAITGQIVLTNFRRTLSDSLEEEVRASFHAYASLWQSRTDLLTSVSLIISGMPDVRAAFSTGDQATIRDSAGELWSKISSSSGIFLVTEPGGRVIASLGGVTAPALLSASESPHLHHCPNRLARAERRTRAVRCRLGDRLRRGRAADRGRHVRRRVT